MSTSFSILSVSIRPEVGEQITLGLLIVGTNKILFRYSKDKLNITKELLPEKKYEYVRDSIRDLNKYINHELNIKSAQNNYNEQPDNLPLATFNSFLDTYSNNQMVFSRQMEIDLSPSEEVFNSLYEKYVDARVCFEDLHDKEFELKKIDLASKVYKYYNIDQQITEDQLPGLAFPIKINMIGRNKILVYAQWIDIHRRLYHVKFDVGNLALLNNALSRQDKKFVVSSEPDKARFPEHHRIWTNLKKNMLAEYVDITEVEKIEEYAVRHGVHPLMTL